MKKLTLFLVSVLFMISTYGQDYAVLRYGSTNSTNLNPGDTIYVPVYCDEISDGLFIGLQLGLIYDSSVIQWLGDDINPTGGVINFNPAFPYGPDWMFTTMPDEINVNWMDPNMQGTGLNSGDILFTFVFIYNGGETQLSFSSNSGFGNTFTMYLIDGCVCSEPEYPAIFHISSNGNVLAGAEILINGETFTSDNLGIGIISLPAGNYDYEVSKSGYETFAGNTNIVNSANLVNVSLNELTFTNLFTKQKMTLSPNPVSGRLFLKLENTDDKVSFDILDVSGKAVKSGESLNTNDIQLNVSDLNQGVYFIRVNTGLECLSKKFIKR